ARLDGVSPVRKLSGGYGYVSGPDGKPVTSAAARKAGDEVLIFLKDGELRTEVKEVRLSDEFERR
ncbi:MAG: exodeoxyribonuclease VII large subunit, partial [Lachnospiraceae bacterium]|nr:exodeoxyribonuclease VII large subunit [Lachnospiraceae bacterium]